MNDRDKTREELLSEIAFLRRSLEDSEGHRGDAEKQEELLREIILVIDAAEALNDALSALLHKICHVTGWVYGEVWTPSPDKTFLKRSPLSCCKYKELERFGEESNGFTFAPGKGLPGRVWLSKKPLWIRDVTEDPEFLRSTLAAEAGLKTALAVPITYDDELVAVPVFFMREARDEDDRFVRIISAVCKQLGWVIRGKKAAENLRRSEEYCRSLIENSLDIVTIVNPDGTIRYASPSVKTFLGYVPEELHGKNAFDYIHQDDLFAAREQFMKVMESPGLIAELIFRFRHRDGSWKFIESVGKQIDLDHDSGVISNSRDITARRKTEEDLISLKKAVESMQIGVTISDLKGRIVYTNPAEARMHGYAVDELIGQDVRIFSPPEQWQPIDAANVGKIKGFWRQRLNLRKDGSAFPVYLISDAVRNDSGEVIGLVTTCGDMTESRKMEEELQKVARLESLGMLAGGIAHDFNNILSIILGKISYARMLEDKDATIAETLSSAEKGCRRAQELTNQLLTFSMGGSPVRKNVSMAEFLKESVEFALRGSNITYDLNVKDELWPVSIDEGQINQVINNIIMNACQAMPQGGKIEIETRNHLEERGEGSGSDRRMYVRIDIMDHGAGIRREDLSRIFDPFFTTKQNGSGLGLATSYSIIKKHGGEIRVESEIGVGTTFIIYLPASGEGVGDTAESEINSGSSNGVLGGSILVIDDEEDIRDVTVRILRHKGYEASSAADGAEGITLYTKARNSGKPFDAVLMDLTIPGGMGGIEAIRRLRDIDPEVKAIVTSGYSNDSAMGNYKAYGFKDVIVKPYSVENLFNILEKVLAEGKGPSGR